MPEAVRHEQPDERTAPLEHGVRGNGRAVQDRIELGELDARAPRCDPDAFDHAAGLVLRRARRLREPDPLTLAVVQQHVGERASDVDPEAIGHGSFRPATTGRAYFATRTSQLRACPSKFSMRD